MPEHRQVTVATNGRAGTIWYREGALELPFDWEFGGSCLAIIYGASLSALRDNGTLSPRRAREILEFVASEVIAQKAPHSTFEIDERRCQILVR